MNPEDFKANTVLIRCQSGRFLAIRRAVDDADDDVVDEIFLTGKQIFDAGISDFVVYLGDCAQPVKEWVSKEWAAEITKLRQEKNLGVPEAIRSIILRSAGT